MSTARKCKTKYIAKSFILCFVISVFLVLSVKIITAQSTNETTRTLIISPPTVNEQFDPGAKKEGKMKFTNKGPKTLRLKAVIRDFVVEDTVGTPLIDPQTPIKEKYAASSWIGVYPSTFTVGPGKTQEINYYIQVPTDARPGGRYAAVVYEPQDNLDVQGTGTGVETHIGTLFVFRVNGDVVENATVKSFASDKKFYEYGPAMLKAQIVNFSDTHITPQGTITLKNTIGQTVATAKLDEHNIFPEAIRDFTNTLGTKYMFGMYTAELKATYGSKNNLTLFATTSFFVLPWKIAGVVALIIVVIILLLIFLRKRKKKTPSAPPINPTQPQTPQAPAQPQQAPQATV